MSDDHLFFCTLHIPSDDTSWASTPGVLGWAANGSVKRSDRSAKNNKGQETLGSYLIAILTSIMPLSWNAGYKYLSTYKDSSTPSVTQLWWCASSGEERGRGSLIPSILES